jgi:hypothetical protein
MATGTPAIDAVGIRVGAAGAPRLPAPRGPLSEYLCARLRAEPHDLVGAPTASDDPLVGEDAALSLYLLYELHYRSFAGVDERWEWHPSLLAVRATLEAAFERRLLELVDRSPTPPDAVVETLVALAADDHGPSLSSYMLDCGTIEEMREFAVHRSAYQLKEADPHTWAIPRLSGRAKAALVDIQTGEYGDGIAPRVHATLFAGTMEVLGLDPTYGHYLDLIPGPTLATVNLVTFFGLHRRWRAALVGHLALFEMCSVVPMGRYAAALRRLGFGAGAPFYDEHVEADARHQIIALHDMAGTLARDEPGCATDIVFGARAVQHVEAVFAHHLLQSWASGRTSLRRPIVEQ